MKPSTLFIVLLVIIILGLVLFWAYPGLFEGEGITRKVTNARLGGENSGIVSDENTGILEDINTHTGGIFGVEDGDTSPRSAEGGTESEDTQDNGQQKQTDSAARTFQRTIMQTGDLKHSIPLEEILSGGPPKDGIPSIDDPKFVNVDEAQEFLSDSDVGLGVTYKGESRFYPYQILVWHEIINDTVAGDPLLVTYCPLCATGIVFDRRVDGIEQEFGVSGRLWQSNLLMYNRASNPDDESLWSQVLGEAVVGPNTGEKLGIISSDTVRFSDWVNAHPNTIVLSRDTGAIRSYGRDPYGDYYTNESVSFGATFNDDRAHPKEFVLGVEVNGSFKAYPLEALPVGSVTDTVGGVKLTVTKNDIDEVNITDKNGNIVPTVDGFWFSWLAVHEDTELYSIN